MGSLRVFFLPEPLKVMKNLCPSNAVQEDKGQDGKSTVGNIKNEIMCLGNNTLNCERKYIRSHCWSREEEVDERVM